MTVPDPFAQSLSNQANVARALSELRRGGAIAISAGSETAIAIAADNTSFRAPQKAALAPST